MVIFSKKIVFNNLYSSYIQKLIRVPPRWFYNKPTIYLVNEIHEAFEDRNSLEVCTVFLDISEAFDKVWHGLIFKLKQNGISDRLLLFVQKLSTQLETMLGP